MPEHDWTAEQPDPLAEAAQTASALASVALAVATRRAQRAAERTTDLVATTASATNDEAATNDEPDSNDLGTLDDKRAAQDTSSRQVQAGPGRSFTAEIPGPVPTGPTVDYAPAVLTALGDDLGAQVLADPKWPALADVLAERDTQGAEPVGLLREALAERDLSTANSAAAVLRHRLDARTWPRPGDVIAANYPQPVTTPPVQPTARPTARTAAPPPARARTRHR